MSHAESFYRRMEQAVSSNDEESVWGMGDYVTSRSLGSARHTPRLQTEGKFNTELSSRQ